MEVVVYCEKSGIVREALRRRGVDAWSNDIEPADDNSPYHIQDDARNVLKARKRWDGFIAHPECTFLTVAGQHWVSRGRIEKDGRARAEHVREALEFTRLFFDDDTEKKIIENPISILSSQSWAGKPSQIVQPYQFGADASKATCFWIRGCQLLIIRPENYVAPRQVFYDGKLRDRWANQTDSGQNRLGPSETRSADRARTYPLIGEALAEAMCNGKA